MRFIKVFLILAVMLGVSACSSKFKNYYGPEVTQVVVNKSDRKMYLLHHNKVLKAYDVGLGFAPAGHKAFEGDGRTPEGDYTIDRRNPNSKFYLSIGINYPNEADAALAKALEKRPGGDIFIHGQGPSYKRGSPRDWTAGCIAITDKQMRDVYAMVKDGTPIRINP